MYWNTVTPLLKQILKDCMTSPALDPSRLVGGTSLSLRIGHRMSDDIDLFIDLQYGNIDFKKIERFFIDNYKYVDSPDTQIIGMGKSFYIGTSERNAVKVDIYYTEEFIRPIIKAEEHIRFASFEDIIAMKLEVVGNGGRKKDFWDLHALHDKFDIQTMITLYKERYPYSYNEAEIRSALINFKSADDDLDPICLIGKHWELIKLDFVEWLSS